MVLLHLTQHSCHAGAGACHVPLQDLVYAEQLLKIKRTYHEESYAVSSAMN